MAYRQFFTPTSIFHFRIFTISPIQRLEMNRPDGVDLGLTAPSLEQWATEDGNTGPIYKITWNEFPTDTQQCSQRNSAGI
jgi:hypothetical protein